MSAITATNLIASIFEQIREDGRYISRKEADAQTLQTGKLVKSTGQTVYAKLRTGHYPTAAHPMRGKADTFLATWREPAKPRWVDPIGFKQAVTLFTEWSNGIKRGIDPIILDFGSVLPAALLMFTLSGKSYFKATANKSVTLTVDPKAAVTTSNSTSGPAVTTDVQVNNPCGEVDIFGDPLGRADIETPRLRYFVKVTAIIEQDSAPVTFHVENKSGERARFRLNQGHAIVQFGMVSVGDCIVLIARRVVDPMSDVVTLKNIKFLENKTRNSILDNAKSDYDVDLWGKDVPTVNWTR